MKGFFQNLYRELKLRGKSSQMLVFWVTLGVFGIVLIINLIVLSKFLAWLSLVVFIVTASVLIVNTLGLINAYLEVGIREKELEAIVLNLKEAVIVYDPNFKILNFNPSAEAIFGVTAQEIVGEYINPSFGQKPHFKLLTQVMFPSLAPRVKQVSESDSWPQITDISIEEPPLELRTTLNKITDKNGKLLGFLKLVKDLTREKAIVREKEEFVGVAAHQLRTPLTAINWALESLLKMTSKDSAEIQETIKQTLQASERTLKIINDLLNVSSIEEGKFGYNFKDTELLGLIKNIMKEMLPLAKQYAVNLYFNTREKEPFPIKVDDQRLMMALSNIIDNAIKYNIKNGEVTVILEKEGDEPFVRISVKDTGVGIPKDEFGKIFQKFSRGSNAVQREPNGSGLGLYIVKNIVERHGGKIGIESTPDRGTTVWFTLPLDPKLIPQKEVAFGEA